MSNRREAIKRPLAFIALVMLTIFLPIIKLGLRALRRVDNAIN